MKLSKLHKQLDVIIDKVHFSSHLVFAMGSDINVGYIQDYLKFCQLKIDAILDNNSMLQGKLINECRVFSPEKALKPFNDKAVILVFSPAYGNQIKLQLEQMGYQENKHIFVIKDFRQNKNDFLNYINSMKAVKKGYNIYNNILKKYGENTHIFICRGATGDVYLNGLFLKEYAKKNNIDNYVLAGDAKALTKIAPLFGIDNLVELTYFESEQLQKVYMFLNFNNISDIFKWQYSLYFNRSRIRMTEKFDFMDTYNYYIYKGLVDKSEWNSPRFKEMDSDLENSFLDKGIVKGKSIIIAPLAYSVNNLPVQFWDEVARALVQRGYKVFANTNPSNEINSFAYMESIFFTFAESVPLLEYAGNFLGLRSGLCDIVSFAKCKQVLLYPIKPEPLNYSVHRSDIEFSGLQVMKLKNENIIEIASPVIKDITNNSGTKISIFALSAHYEHLKQTILAAFE